MKTAKIRVIEEFVVSCPYCNWSNDTQASDRGKIITCQKCDKEFKCLNIIEE